ncbi:MAG: hypothetical protein K1X74_07460 [Pirellulales bacterium]|nr:hypothetical protein [Pirellulales bacterium]
MSRLPKKIRRLGIERCEDRRLMAVIGLDNGVLSVIGDSTPDRIYMTSPDGITATVSVLDAVTLATKATGTFDLDEIVSLEVQCFGGNDNVECNLDKPATIDGGYGNDTLYGGFASDVLVGGVGNDVLHGGLGHDTLIGSEGSDQLHGDVGMDSLDGGAGQDSLFGGTGNDTLFGGSENDSLDGEGDNDLIYGDAGNDALNGGAGYDTLAGGTGYDTTHGGTGNDQIYTDALDQVYGDEGTDWFDGLSERLSGGIVKSRNPNPTVYRDWGRL